MNIDELEFRNFWNECKRTGIHNPSQLLKSKNQIFSWLEGCFPRGSLPTDLDGIIEINGHFLVIELKPASVIRNGEPAKGQRLCFMRLLELGCFTIFWIGEDDTKNMVCLRIWHNGEERKHDPCDSNEIREACRNWSQWADQTKRIT